MDPEFYRAMNSVSSRQSKVPLPNIPDPPQQGEQSNAYESWTVFSPQIARGNFQPVDPNDPRLSVGWRGQREPPMPWGTAVQPQPFMWSGEQTQNDNEE
jgi:hypothetical protein